MRIGLLLEGEEGLTWPDWRGVCSAAEELGFASVWISDHLASPWADRTGLEAWTALAVAAAETARVRFGPLVSPVTFRAPALVARMAEQLWELSQGRFTLGLGLGWNEQEHARFGVAFPSVGERVRLLEETVQRLEGKVPVLIGGSGEKATLPLVARYADEWNMTTASAEVVAHKTTVLSQLCRDVGRDPGAIKKSVAVGFLIGRDDAELRDRARRMQACVPPFADVPLEDVRRTAEEMGWLVGTPAELIERLKALDEVGVEEVLLGHYDPSDHAALELLAGEVLRRV
jgi:alkanesulfonate monooxygenase SsuD/methylene tetrahydromethanopterin reductase-like flavin-dependent oxidoreductase (luciferase family)